MKKLGLMLGLMAMVAMVSAQDGKTTAKQVNKKAKTEQPAGKACAGGKEASACCANKGNTASCNSTAAEKSCCSKGGTTTGSTGTGCQGHGHAATTAPAGDTKKQ